MHCCVLCVQPVLLTYGHFNHNAQPTTLRYYLRGGTKSNCRYSQGKKNAVTQYSRVSFWFLKGTCFFVKHSGTTSQNLKPKRSKLYKVQKLCRFSCFGSLSTANERGLTYMQHGDFGICQWGSAGKHGSLSDGLDRLAIEMVFKADIQIQLSMCCSITNIMNILKSTLMPLPLSVCLSESTQCNLTCYMPQLNT